MTICRKLDWNSDVCRDSAAAMVTANTTLMSVATVAAMVTAAAATTIISSNASTQQLDIACPSFHKLNQGIDVLAQQLQPDCVELQLADLFFISS
mmetsp:Transcript_11074/g.14587  ORF Transcript_11074/g.14587 Transcript_11074/m.14587 type:complete len:95 (-) Transcript_11074:42-326(-)